MPAEAAVPGFILKFAELLDREGLDRGDNVPLVAGCLVGRREQGQVGMLGVHSVGPEDLDVEGLLLQGGVVGARPVQFAPTDAATCP